MDLVKSRITPEMASNPLVQNIIRVLEEKKTEKLFDSLMGKNPEYRYKFIQENANFTNNLDI